jgi:hypothetical protein
MTAPDMPPMKVARMYTQMFLKFQKAMAGPRALAGFIAPPVKGPAAKEPTTTARPIASGAKGAGRVTCTTESATPAHSQRRQAPHAHREHHAMLAYYRHHMNIALQWPNPTRDDNSAQPSLRNAMS